MRLARALLGAAIVAAAGGCFAGLPGESGGVIARMGATGGLFVSLRGARQTQALDGVIEKVTVALTAASVPDGIAIDVPRSRFSSGKARVEFGGLLPGKVHVAASLYNKDSVKVGHADADADVAADKTTQLQLTVVPEFASASFAVDTSDVPAVSASMSLDLEPVATGSWQPAPPLAIARGVVSAVPIGDHVWAVGGDASDLLERYDPATGRWTPFPVSNDARITRPIAAAAALRGKIVVVGRDIEVGMNETSVPYFLDPDSLDAFQHQLPAPDGSLPSSFGDTKEFRTAVGVAASGDRLFMVGGSSRRASGTSYVFISFPTLEVFSAQTGFWSELAPMPTARGATATAVSGGKLYVAGGFKWSGTPATDPMLGRLAGVTHTDATLAALDVFEAYDPATDGWSTLAKVPAARYGAALVASSGRLYLLGGADGNGMPVTRVDSYDSTKNTWRSEPALLEARAFLGAAVLSGGKILALGGYGSGKLPLRTAEIFNPGGQP